MSKSSRNFGAEIEAATSKVAHSNSSTLAQYCSPSCATLRCDYATAFLLVLTCTPTSSQHKPPWTTYTTNSGIT